MNALWERPDFRRAAGEAWRPGGVDLTRRTLGWCASAGLLAPGALVVDLGSGAGATVRLLAQLGYRAVGLDKNSVDAALAGALAADGCRLVRADLEHPPLAKACVDCVLCECVLSLLTDPLAALRSAFSALRPGGLLVVSDLMLRPGYAPPTLARADSGHARADHDHADHDHAEQANPAQHAAPGTSCLAGARPESAWRGLLQAAGFQLTHFEDNSRALVELAARMIWYGDAAPRSAPMAGGAPDVGAAEAPRGCACGGSAPGKAWRAYGYGLWVGRKETL